MGCPLHLTDFYVLHFAGSQTVKNLPAEQETQVESLAQEDPLEKEMATPSSILAWEIPWTETPGGLQSMELLSWTQLSTHTLCEFYYYCNVT